MADVKITPTRDTEEERTLEYMTENREAIIAQYVDKISTENLTQNALIERLAFSEWLLDMKDAVIEDLKKQYMPQEKQDELVSVTSEFSFYAGGKHAITESTRRAAAESHKEHHALREYVIEHYLSNRHLFTSKDEAAEKMVTIVPLTFRTIRGYLNNL
jgi:hypothetical protein